MLFHNLADTNSAAYFEQMTFDVNGDLNVDVFIRSLESLMQRHTILRTNIYQGWRDIPLQIVYKHKSSEWCFEDLRRFDVEEQKKYLNSYVESNKARGFQLSEDTLIRVAIFQIDEEVHRVIWSFHHILMDGWCLPLILKEWFEQYEVLTGNSESKHITVTPYSQYIEWLLAQDEEEASRYWKEYLADYEEQTIVPNLGVHPEQEGYRSESVICELGQALTHQIQQIAARNQVTMNTVMQTIWGVLLQKYNNSNDVVFGSVVSGRPEGIPGIEKYDWHVY